MTTIGISSTNSQPNIQTLLALSQHKKGASPRFPSLMDIAGQGSSAANAGSSIDKSSSKVDVTV